MAIVAGDGQHLRGHVFGQAVGEVFAVDVDDFGDACDGGCSFGSGFGAFACNQHVHVTAELGG